MSAPNHPLSRYRQYRRIFAIIKQTPDVDNIEKRTSLIRRRIRRNVVTGKFEILVLKG